MSSEETRPDGYVRIPTSALRGVELRHLLSEKDLSIAVPPGAAITGITEWVGSWREQAISVGWDWAVIDGLVVLINPNEIRTNISSFPPAAVRSRSRWPKFT